MGSVHGSSNYTTTLRDSIAQSTRYILQGAKRILSRNNPMRHEQHILNSKKVRPKEFWALRNISFEVQQGEVVGIIGKNGAGKTTLLKILSQITEPTEGEIRIRGRVGSLLEVGTGFHPELTGQENIFMNGLILGMTRDEIKRRFDEIVAFAEIGKFVNTPVKRYSSGMLVRLGFAVAAHLETEILIVDEVLAVGDVAFQKRCFNKMDDARKTGKTILLVSHNMGIVKELCSKAILLENGIVKAQGDVSEVIDVYLNSIEHTVENELVINFDRKENLPIQITSISACDSNGKLKNEFYLGEDIRFMISVSVEKRIIYPRFSLEILSMDGIPIYQFVMVDSGLEIKEILDEIKLAIIIRKVKLYPGKYRVKLWVASSSAIPEETHTVEDAFYFSILPGGPFVSRPLDRRHALIHEVAEWEIVD